MVSMVGLTAPGSVAVLKEDDERMTAQQVRVRTLYSGISAGTELTSYRGSSPHLTKHWDGDRRLFRAGGDQLVYPVTALGYEEVGEVVEVGDDVAGVAVGDRIWGTWGHRTNAVLDGAFAAARRLETGVDPRIGIFSHIGAVALNVVLDADLHVGETVAVFGLGVPGQLVAQLARLNGARVIAVDGIASRRELALELGADLALDPADGEVAERIRELTGGRGADAALEITGNYRALHEAIRSVAYGSRVCVGGFFQGEGTGLALGEEFHHNRVQLISSQISGVGAALQHRWDRYRLWSTAIELASRERLRVLPLISHEVPWQDAAEAYRLLDETPAQALQVVLDFTGGAR
ncbi:2-desacetyl-2-hydroxyethyl bacteriochlorophyllide A dehydrogenase [Diaminobutyricimonas aerilata]|uniref:2-desacetyl-2-hydroxyethyl bacteriochlorophyllide A dehydrogenase n=1 Tax=Diaminobutyricimonas aerilata TaxID=1162967 RepID=A0A2M9CL24_9MICO|nr:zinc-binding alcohol dehydrogenase [Diaminobutyricimonas aerilata]PJJ72598.1 2-desacetyl-2-hydroxyethyl bacteriochlorophyllide A dehydrogenase [Diaminobutyricimonas aerilata]